MLDCSRPHSHNLIWNNISSDGTRSVSNDDQSGPQRLEWEWLAQLFLLNSSHCGVRSGNHPTAQFRNASSLIYLENAIIDLWISFAQTHRMARWCLKLSREHRWADGRGNHEDPRRHRAWSRQFLTVYGCYCHWVHYCNYWGMARWAHHGSVDAFSAIFVLHSA